MVWQIKIKKSENSVRKCVVLMTSIIYNWNAYKTILCLRIFDILLDYKNNLLGMDIVSNYQVFLRYQNIFIYIIHK